MTVNEMDICLQSGLRVAPLMPFVSGKAIAPNTLTGKLISNEMYQWVRDTVDIPGATSETYNLTPEDIGHLIRVRMHFTDADNNFHTVISKPMGPIQSGGAFVNAGTFAVNTGGTSLVVPMPADLVPGNLVLVWMAGNASQTASAVAGWTFINNATTPDYVAAYRIVDGSEGASVTFNYPGNVGLVGQALQFSGVNSVTPIGVHNTNTGTGTTASNTGITTSSARSIVLGIVQANSNQVIPVPDGWAAAAGGANSGSAPYAFGSRALTKFVAPAGATGALSVPIASASWRVSLYELIARDDCCA